MPADPLFGPPVACACARCRDVPEWAAAGRVVRRDSWCLRHVVRKDEPGAWSPAWAVLLWCR